MAKNVYRKKLTNSGGGVCTMTCFAAIFALCAAAGDFIAGAVYTQFYKNQVYDMTPDPIGFIEKYSFSIVMAVFSLIMFIRALSAAKGKLLGREYGWMGIFMGLFLSLDPAVKIYRALSGDFIKTYFDTSYDSDKFRGAIELAKMGLPVIAGLLIFTAGIAVLARVSGEYFVVEAPRADKKKAASRKAQKTDDAAHSFGGGAGKVQGLTGETKPATYGERSDDETPAVHETTEEKPAKKATVNLCPNCGELVSADELFCSNCGHKM